MPAPKAQNPASLPPVPWYQLKITLKYVEPAVWRRVLVRGDVSLGALHDVIQAVMGWDDDHLHAFTVGKVHYSCPYSDEGDESGDADESAAILMQVAPSAKKTFRYEYDFGDSWTHEILVEKIAAADPATKGVANCLDGGGACPPEDCGGAGGYARMLEILQDPRHEEYESTVEWLGKGYDPEKFDLAAANRRLRKRMP